MLRLGTWRVTSDRTELGRGVVSGVVVQLCEKRACRWDGGDQNRYYGRVGEVSGPYRHIGHILSDHIGHMAPYQADQTIADLFRQRDHSHIRQRTISGTCDPLEQGGLRAWRDGWPLHRRYSDGFASWARWALCLGCFRSFLEMCCFQRCCGPVCFPAMGRLGSMQPAFPWVPCPPK